MQPTNPIPNPAPTAPNGRYTMEQYTALKAALASGARSVRYGDQEVQFQSPQAMRDTLALMELELNINSAPRRSFPSFGKGLL